jgi:hypothetical protein
MKRICIVFPLPKVPRLPGTALVLRVAWTERRDVKPIIKLSVASASLAALATRINRIHTARMSTLAGDLSQIRALFAKLAAMFLVIAD